MKILVMYATAGHGHKKAAEYVCAELEKRKQEGMQLDITEMDLFDITPKAFVKTYPVSYEFMVSKIPWFWGIAYWLSNIQWIAKALRPIRRFYNWINSKELRKFLIKERFDILIFPHFFPPEVSTALKKKRKINSTIVTIMTDFFPHSTWINPGTDHYIVMTEDSKKAIAVWGEDPERIHVLGIPVGEQFEVSGKTCDERKTLGLQPEKMTILLTSGSFGIGPFEELLKQLEVFQNKIQVIIVCGNNKNLFNKLVHRTFPFAVKVFGFVDNMDQLMEASDIVISKSGGITTCETLAKMVPLVISKPIPGQEAGNKRYLLDHDCGFSISTPQDIVSIVQSILEDDTVLKKKKENIAHTRKPSATRDIVDFVLSLGK